MSWKHLGDVAATDLVDARLQLHHASQAVAAVGVTFLDPQPDDSHPNFGWVESQGALLGRSIPGADVRVGLRVADLSLLLVDAAGAVEEALELDGRTLAETYAWLTAVTKRAGARVPPTGLARTAYEIPGHAVADGGSFSRGSGDAFAELARWFANGHHVLTALAGRTAGASEVRCWPHHFDLGALAVVASQPDGSLAKSIGLGLSPGDEGYAEPYWYISPWPYPEPAALPALESGGHWHTEGYTSAILTGSDLIGGSSEGQSERLCEFLDGAVDASQRVLAN